MKIRAAVLERFGEPLEVQELELAEPQAGEVLVRLVACGVCHTDLYSASGADPSGYAPTVLGHEGAGVVEEVGEGVTGLQPGDHPWRSMPHHGMTPHTSGTSLSAQARYAAGAREILACWFDGRPIREEYLIVDGGTLAGAGAHAYSEGDATGGHEEAARFKSG